MKYTLTTTIILAFASFNIFFYFVNEWLELINSTLPINLFIWYVIINWFLLALIALGIREIFKK